jgi:hypothetical protein
MYVDAHRGLGGGKAGRVNIGPPRRIPKDLLINAIKLNIGTPLAIFPESLDPPRYFGKNLSYPLPWIFKPCASMLIKFA